MSETPIYDELAKKYGLTDHQIENPLEYYHTPSVHLDLENDEVVINNEVWGIPEREHEDVQPPVFEFKTVSHEQELLEIIGVTPEIKLVHDIADVTQHVDAARSLALAA